MDIETRLSRMKSRYEQGRGQLALLRSQIATVKGELRKAEADLEVWHQVQALFSRVSEFAREQLKRRIEQTVTAALQAVFDDDILEFRVRLGERAGQPTAEWEVAGIYGNEIVANSPEDGRGGGIVDVVSLALRLALLELSRPKPDGPVVLDEPGKHLSQEYAPNLAAFLKTYAGRTGRQVLLVTHNQALTEAADRSYRVEKVDGESRVVGTA